MKRYSAIIFTCVPNTPHFRYLNTYHNIDTESNEDNAEIRFINKTIQHYKDNKITDDVFGAIGRLEGEAYDAYICFVSESIETLEHIKSKAPNNFNSDESDYLTMAFFLS